MQVIPGKVKVSPFIIPHPKQITPFGQQFILYVPQARSTTWQVMKV
jgi:hypothetical protein